MNKKTNGYKNGHRHHSLLSLEQERSELLDGELELTYGPNGVTRCRARRSPEARSRRASPSASVFPSIRSSPG